MSNFLKLTILLVNLFIFYIIFKQINEPFQDSDNSDGLKYSDYEINEQIEQKLLDSNFIKPKKISYTLGKSGIGKIKGTHTIGFDTNSIQSIIPDAIKKYGNKKIVNLKTLVPFLWHIIKNQNKHIQDSELNFEKLRVELIEIKKKM